MNAYIRPASLLVNTLRQSTIGRSRGRGLGLLFTLLLSAALLPLSGQAQFCPNGTTVAGGNGAGSAPNQLDRPLGSYVDGSGNVYVADTYNSRIQKWRPGATSGTTVAGGNGEGSAPNQLYFPSGVFVDGSGNVYVADDINSRIQKWAPGALSGTTVAGTGGDDYGSAPNQLNRPSGVFVDGLGNVYVADTYNNRIQKWPPGATSGTTVAGGNGEGSAPNQLFGPTGVFVDGSGNVYVADAGNNRIQKWGPNASAGTTVAGGNGAGSAPNQLNFPYGVFVDGSGNVYVADDDNSRIQKWPPGATSGTTVAGGNGKGGSANQLTGPKSVFVDGSGNLFVTDQFNQRIQRFSPGSPIGFTQQPPASQSVCVGTTVTAAVSVSGTVTAYQWYKDGGVVSGQTSATLSLPNTTTANAGSYSVVVTGSCNSVTSTAFNLTVTPRSPDYQALADFYNSTNGPNWTRKGGWLTGCSPCNWEGVSCDGNGRVTGLDLLENKLTGTIPASLSTLTSLISLELGDNPGLVGGIPQGITSLTQLQTLNLSNTQLGGAIPTSLGNLTKLSRLYINNSQLTGTLPTSLGNLSNLTEFFAYQNQFTGSIPAIVGNLSKLTQLDLANNQLTGSIPASLGNLTRLQYIVLDTNQLSGCFPVSLTALCGREVVSFATNPGLPGGGNFDAFCANGAGSDAFAPLATASPNPACIGNPVSLSVSAGTSYAWSGPAGFASTQQSPTFTASSATQSGVYSVTVSNGSPNCFAITNVNLTVSTPSVPSLQASALQTTNQPISVTATGCAGGTVNWLPQGGQGQASGSIYTFSQPGSYSLSASCTVGACTSAQTTPIALQILPGGFAITQVTMVQCALFDEAKQGYQVRFTPQYSGQNTNPIRFSVVNELAPTTAPAPYQLRLYTDNPIITLVASQPGNPEARYQYNWLASCQSGTTTNRPPTTTGIPSQTLTQGQPYQLTLTDYFSDPDGQSLSFVAQGLPPQLTVQGSRLQGTPTQSGQYAVTVTAIDPQGLQVSSRFPLTVADAPAPGSFTITGVSLVSCQVVSGGQRRVSFTPQYAGLDGSPVSFSVVNELLPTTQPGPYTLNLYTDNPVITLSAQQGNNPVASYRYGWLSGCGGSARLGTGEASKSLQVVVLGNPVAGSQAEVAVTGAEGQPLRLELSNSSGQAVIERVIKQAGAVERQTLSLEGQGGGLLLLRVSTPTQSQTVKLVKAN